VNLGLGFAIAIKAGRGPWSRYARRLAMKEARKEVPTGEDRAESGTSSELGSESAPNPAKPIEEIACELEAMEARLLQLQERIAAGGGPDEPLADLRTAIRDGVGQIEALDVANVTPEYPEQATAGLYALQVVLETVASDLDETGARVGAAELNTAASRVLMAYREAGVVFNGLRFAELPV
jgi:hypothetical protein